MTTPKERVIAFLEQFGAEIARDKRGLVDDVTMRLAGAALPHLTRQLERKLTDEQITKGLEILQGKIIPFLLHGVDGNGSNPEQ